MMMKRIDEQKKKRDDFKLKKNVSMVGGGILFFGGSSAQCFIELKLCTSTHQHWNTLKFGIKWYETEADSCC